MGAYIDTNFNQFTKAEDNIKDLETKYRAKFGGDILQISKDIKACLDECDYMGILFIYKSLQIILSESHKLMSEQKESIGHA